MKECLPKYHIPYRRISILFLMSITLDISLFLIPLAYSQEFHYVSSLSGFGSGNRQLSQPAGIAVDQKGNVYVADTANNRIQVFSSNGTFISKWGQYGNLGNNSFNSPEGIAVDQKGNVYVADTANNKIKVFSSNGTFISTWGRYGSGAGMLKFPEDVAIDPSSGSVYVADTANNRIQVFSSNGTFIS